MDLINWSLIWTETTQTTVRWWHRDCWWKLLIIIIDIILCLVKCKCHFYQYQTSKHVRRCENVNVIFSSADQQYVHIISCPVEGCITRGIWLVQPAERWEHIQHWVCYSTGRSCTLPAPPRTPLRVTCSLPGTSHTSTRCRL